MRNYRTLLCILITFIALHSVRTASAGEEFTRGVLICGERHITTELADVYAKGGFAALEKKAKRHLRKGSCVIQNLTYDDSMNCDSSTHVRSRGGNQVCVVEINFFLSRADGLELNIASELTFTAYALWVRWANASRRTIPV